MSTPKRYLMIGAHPDDADIVFGGCAVKLAGAGHVVRFVSCCNGDAGHWDISRSELAERRRGEAEASAAAGGLESYVVLGHSDCSLEATLENRREMIRMIRSFAPDVIVTHRLCDYHADHRATSQLVQDAAYLISVPLECPEVSIPEREPIILLAWDRFKRPYPHEATIAVDVDDVIDTKLAMMNCHESQFYEWLPYNQKRLDKVPQDHEGRMQWLTDGWLCRNRVQAEDSRELLMARYGEAGKSTQFAETLELSEYGRQPDEKELETLLPR